LIEGVKEDFEDWVNKRYKKKPSSCLYFKSF
jgi:hypothetical protein